MKTLQDTAAHLSRVFGRRDRLYLPSVAARADELLYAVDVIQDGVRKGVTKKQLEEALAYAVTRAFSCVDAYGDVPFVETLATKYPVTKCIYCHKRPCGCTERRERHVLVRPNAVQCRWSLKQWCASFQATYGVKNSERGVYYCLTRLNGEISELKKAQSLTSKSAQSINDYERDIVLELADVFAWLIAVANVLKIDLMAAVKSRFGSGCDVCNKKTCECTHYDTRRATLRAAKKKR